MLDLQACANKNCFSFDCPSGRLRRLLDCGKPFAGSTAMPSSRRRFLQQFIAAQLAVVAMGVPTVKASGTARDAFGYSRFAPLRGKTLMVVATGGERVALKLVDVSRSKSLRGFTDIERAREHCFSLILRGDGKQPIAEGIVRIEGAGAAFEAFMSPILGDGKTYQIVFGNA